MQLGFVIDQSRCIGCHACTVACKSENDVPLGAFRTWVKYTEAGAFPEVRRSFTVLRCNQCSDAPCVTICPVHALDKGTNGIVDVDPKLCVGCKGCMHACPYDALYINEDTGTAQKCHFCAHRTEVGLAPACAVICPTEAIVPGDFDDPNSRVSRMKKEFQLTARKTEAGTGPNVLYRDAHPAGIDPQKTSMAGQLIWSNKPAGFPQDAREFTAMEERATARTVYDVPRKPLWGGLITGYLFFKSLAAGVFLVGIPVLSTPKGSWVSLLSLAFLFLTLIFLVADLKRPDRFLFFLLKPNWKSWLSKGSFILTAYGALLTACLGFTYAGERLSNPAMAITVFLAAAAAIGSAIYTAWLFYQAKGRPLWMKQGFSFNLLAQALIAGSGLLLVLSCPIIGMATPAWNWPYLRWVLIASLAFHLVLTLAEPVLAPAGREKEYSLAARLISHGPFARRHWLVGVGLGILIPILLLTFSQNEYLLGLAGFLALIGLFMEEKLFIKAGQALPIS